MDVPSDVVKLVGATQVQEREKLLSRLQSTVPPRVVPQEAIETLEELLGQSDGDPEPLAKECRGAVELKKSPLKEVPPRPGSSLSLLQFLDHLVQLIVGRVGHGQ